MTPATRAKAAAAVIRFSREQEQAGFHAKILAEPNEDTHKLVYADWLDEHGMEQQAARLRWWVGALRHIQTDPGKMRDHPGLQLDRLPSWVGMAMAAHEVKKHHDDSMGGDEDVDRMAHHVELHAMGIDQSGPISELRNRILREQPADGGHAANFEPVTWHSNHSITELGRLALGLESLRGRNPVTPSDPVGHAMIARGWDRSNQGMMPDHSRALATYTQSNPPPV